MKPKAIILSGYGLNCEEETKHVFDLAGAKSDIVHINDFVKSKSMLRKYQILAVPGGFSYGDDTGSGKAYAGKLKNHAEEEILKFADKDKLILGICNGFQILTNLGLLPGALLANTSARYTDRWVDLKIENESPWLKGITEIPVPIAHGEGRYFADEKTMSRLRKEKSIAATYAKGEMCREFDLPANPNGAMENIAAVTSKNGRILGMMPHPERGAFFTQLPDWPKKKEELLRKKKKPPVFAQGFQIFSNAVDYF